MLILKGGYIMKLIKLYSNKEQFKTVEFNPTGISLIVGIRDVENILNDNKKSSYNGLGKSLIIALVHFCLGSSKKKELEEKLSDWIFYLEFSINDVLYTVKRECKSQDIIFLNNTEMKIKDYNLFLGKSVFYLNEKQQGLSFRSLISRFIRPRKSSYDNYDSHENKESEYDKMLRNGYLLGLDFDLMLNKHRLKQQIDENDQNRKNFKKDNTIKEYFHGDKDLGIDITNLKGKIQRLKTNISDFKIAKDYYLILNEVNALSMRINEYEKEKITLRVTASNIQRTLQLQPDIEASKIIQLYEEAKVNFGDKILKRLKDVEEFNKKLIINRNARLLNDKSKLEKKIKEIEAQIEKYNNQKDEKTQYLKGKGALEEYQSLNEQLKNFEIRLQKLEAYKELQEKYQINQEKLNVKFGEESIKSLSYLRDNQVLANRNMLLFQSLVNEFYGEDKWAGIEVLVNSGHNQQRFDIRVKIDTDKSDGVGSVKLFCFDWTLLRGGYNHNVKYIFHDSRLLSEIDPHQQASIFRVAFKNCKEFNYQYIISTNENMLEGLKKEMDDTEYYEMIESSKILEISDQSNESKLLGFQLDLDYDEE